MLDQLNSIPLK